MTVDSFLLFSRQREPTRRAVTGFFCVLTAVVWFSSQIPVNICKNISLFIVLVRVRFELLQVSLVSCDLLNVSGQKHQAECKTRCIIKNMSA